MCVGGGGGGRERGGREREINMATDDSAVQLVL